MQRYIKLLCNAKLNMSSTPTNIKLYYFNVMAIAEPIRWLLSYGNLPFEDIRLTHDEWQERRSTSPFGTIPILEIDGKSLHQSTAICRYIAKTVGLAGENDWEDFEIDIVVDTTSDLRSKVAVYNKLLYNASERAPLKESLTKETIPFYLTRFEEMASTGYLANGKFSWADIYFVSLLDYFKGVLEECVIDPKQHPNLEKLRMEVISIPEIAAWIAKRPYSLY